MGYPIRIGPDCYGKALLDVEGVFLVVRLARPCPEATLHSTGFKGVVVTDNEAIFIGNASVPIRTTSDEAWLQHLLRMVSASDPLEAITVAERIFLRRIFSRILTGMVEMEDLLKFLKDYANTMKEEDLHRRQFGRAAEWSAWVRDLEDVEPRIRNLSLSLGRFAVRLGNRWLRGEHL